MKIWLACSGEYSQWGPFAAFTSEELAKQHSDDVMELELFDSYQPAEDHIHRDRGGFLIPNEEWTVHVDMRTGQAIMEKRSPE